jgi:hypothetical protein
MHHSTTLLLGKIALTPQTRWDGVSLQNVVVAMLVKFALNSKSITDSVISKAPPTITPLPPCFTMGSTHAEIIRSPTPHLTKTRQMEIQI